MSRREPWRTLGIDPTDDRAAIRRAYAATLKSLDVDSNIEGYARLRDARAHALALAMGLEPVAVDGRGEQLWEPDEEGDAAASLPLENAAAPVEPDRLDEELVPREPTPPAILLAILFPQGEQTDEPLNQDEWELAAHAMAAVIGEAQEATVDQHRTIEEWLAHHLASAWPRSAPLLEEAAAAFGWHDEAGQLSERPAIAYLNERLRGVRFFRAVQEPSHPSHRLWAELSQPGPKGAFAFMRVGKNDVQNLLANIRAHHPELERHLDPVRVASWDASFSDSPWSAWTVVWRIILVVWVIAMFSRLFTPPADPVPPPIQVSLSPSQVDDLVIELFGSRLSDDVLITGAPDILQNIHLASASSGLVFPTAAGKELLVQLRGQTQFAAQSANFSELVAIKQIKLKLLRLVREQRDAWDCLNYARQGVFPSNVDVPEDLRAEERILAAQLAQANLLMIDNNDHLPTRARIPGNVVEQIIQSTGLSRDAMALALQERGNETDQCNYRVALLEAVLQRPAEVSTDLLRMI